MEPGRGIDPGGEGVFACGKGRTRERKVKLKTRLLAGAALALAGAAGPAFADSGIQPGISTGIALGAAPPEGVFVVEPPNYGYRDSKPGQSVGALVPSWLIWSTPWTILGGHLVFDAASPMANVPLLKVGSRE
jgi:hypothetical protein